MLLAINPYTTNNSLFSNILPVTPPEGVEEVTSLPLPVLGLEVVLITVVVLLFLNLVLHYLGVSTYKIYGNLTLKTKRLKLFGKIVGDSELVSVLLKVLEVLREQTEFDKQTTMTTLNEVVYKVEIILTILETQHKDTKLEMLNFLDLKLSHEKYLMSKLVSYLDNNSRVKERIVEESLEAIKDGLDRVVDEYLNTTAKSVEEELLIYNELRVQQKERNYEDLTRRD